MKKFIRLKRTPLKKRSEKQRQRYIKWAQARYKRCVEIETKYGKVICEYCGRPGWGNELGILDGHHMDRNRSNNTPENCYICHRVCHGKIHDKNIKVKQFGFEGLKNGGIDDD